ncbi:MAG: MBL fold metallo-hydrolase [Christensenella sp.]|nr:MBL fold metallo-hydrolase [Christensenella sp.]
MKQIFFKISLSLSLAFLLAGCSVSPDAGTEDVSPASGEVLTAEGEDSSSEAEPSGAQAATPDPAASPAEQPLPALLPADNAFAILFVNVGKADAAILRFGTHTVLIDTGSKDSAPQLLAGLNALRVTQIDAVFITHSHSDHLGGLDALASNYDIPMVYSPFFSETDKNGTGKIVKRAEKLRLAHKELKAGDRVPVADGVSFSVLGPLELNEQDDNDNSLVLQFSYGNRTYLFTGDMQFAEEQTLIDSGVRLQSDVLKVGNHGNPDATGEDFAALVSPSIAIISTNTGEDTDSANPRVYSALSMANLSVTQNFPLGILLTPDGAGGIALSNPAREAAPVSVSVAQIDVDRQSVSLSNSGTGAADLSGCILFSARSGAALRFPQGTILHAGESLTIGAGEALSFVNEEKPLNKKKSNTIRLFSPLGILISELER